MRAILRANSSGSAEPLLIGSDGALTVTPQSGFGAGPVAASSGFRWTLPITAARRIRGACQHVDAVARGQGKTRDLTLLWSYWRVTAGHQFLEFAAILLGGGRGGRR